MKINTKLIKKDIQTKLPLIIIIAIYIFAANMIVGKVCPIRIAFGIPCPSCGITRAFLLLLRGKILKATIMHPLWIPLVILVMVFLFVRYFITDENKALKLMHILKICTVVTIVLCLILYLYRMIAWYPDRAPMLYDADNVLGRIISLFRK